jgi:hypothetical protein
MGWATVYRLGGRRPPDPRTSVGCSHRSVASSQPERSQRSGSVGSRAAYRLHVQFPVAAAACPVCGHRQSSPRIVLGARRRLAPRCSDECRNSSGKWNTDWLCVRCRRQAVHYRGTDGHIHQLSWDNAAWRHLDLTANFGGPAALDAPPTGYVFLGELHVQYLGTDGHIHEFWWNGQWQHQDLTTRTGAPLALTGPSAYVLQKTQHVVFIARNNHIIELLWEP